MNAVNAGLPLSVYVHLPWCISKCPYCDFNSHALRGAVPEQAYVAALLADLDADLPAVEGRTVASVFIGGGTPSLFSGGAIATLLDGLSRRILLDPAAEITLEVNPGTLERGRLADYRRAGVNRLSIGAQSFDADMLRVLGRIHGPHEILAAVAEAGEAGFTNINLDLMYGLPEQTPAQALEDVRAALALAPAHLSHYQLTLEPNTRFHHSPPSLPDEDTLMEIENGCREALIAAGFARYEVSAWSRPGRECRHNLNYWRYGDYLGIGAGAHGKLSTAEGVRRTRRLSHPAAYLQAPSPRLAGHQQPDAQERQFEFLLNALRLREGFTLAQFERATFSPAGPLLAQMREARDRGLLEYVDDRWRATEFGYLHLDGLLTEFLPALIHSSSLSAENRHKARVG